MMKSVGVALRFNRACRRLAQIAGLLGALVISGAAMAAGPGLFTVNENATDLGDNNKGDGACADINGKCSLRAAIEEGNALAGATALTPHSITFSVATVTVINGGLPTMMAPFIVTGPVSIDGSGHGCLSLADSGTIALGYDLGATGSSIIGVNIHGCSGNAIGANGHGYTFTGNVINGNTGAGISLSSSRTYGNFVNDAALDSLFSSFPAFPISGGDVNLYAQQLATVLVTLNPCKIAGNSIFSNNGDGIDLFSENLGAVFVSGNFIGTDPTGDLSFGNGGAGVRLSGGTFGNMIGPGNVIGANADGISVDDPTVYLPNIISGNRIGLPSLTNGTHIGNLGSGITTATKPDDGSGGVNSHKNPSGLALLIGPDNFISDSQGKPNSDDPDVLPTGGAGVFITGASSGVKVLDNTIGMAEIPAGTPLQTTAYGNLGDGIVITSTGNTVSGNTISGNHRHGLVVQGSGNTSTHVTGNTVGLYPAFADNLTLGNGFDGIHIDAASSTYVGGSNAGDGNTVAANGRNGIKIRNGGTTNGWSNLVQRNIIFGNAVGNPNALPSALPPGSGIGLDLDHVEDAADGPHTENPNFYVNLDQAPAVICTGAVGEPAACSGASVPGSGSGQTTLTWTLATHGPAQFRAEFFKIGTADDNTATSMTFLGEQAFATDAAAALTGAGCSNGRCASTVNADASGGRILMTVTDITPLTNVPGGLGDWKNNLICFVGDLGILPLPTCNANNTSEFSNVANVPLSNNADLLNLSISAGTLTPAFAAGTIGYTDSVTNATSSVTVTPTVAESHATIKVKGNTVASGSPSGSIALNVGSGNSIDVVVTAQDGTTQKTYTITVTRAGSTNADLSGLATTPGTLAPVFASGTLAYTESVPNATASITVTPTTSDANATVKVNGTPVTSGSASGSIALNVGSGNTINVVVTAQDGTTTKQYSIVVTRAASSNDALSSLAISAGSLSPAFTSGTLNYSDNVVSGTTSVTVTPTTADANATVKVNNVTVASGSPSGAITLGPAGSATQITVAVTAQDGITTQSYVVTVNRANVALSNNAALNGLAISAGTLSPAFTSNTLGYSDNVVSGTSSVTVTPTAADAGATIAVNAVPVASGATSAPITLAAGPSSTPVNVVVTAADGVTIRTYTVTVNRAGAQSNNDALSNLTISAGTLTPAFSSNTLLYSDNVVTGTTSVTVTPTTADANATVKVNNVSVASGAPSGAIALGAAGSATPVTVAVTAQDGTTTQSYVITVNRAGAASNNASLNNLTISSGMLMPAFAANTLVYADAVANATTSVTVTPTAADAGATITVNGNPVASGGVSAAIALAVGNGNVISVAVTAADTVTTQTYTITVNRAVGAASNNAALANLTISSGTLTPAFAINTLAYTDAVTSATTSVTVTPTAADAGATVKVNGNTVASGSPSAAITLVAGSNPVNVVVTAADLTTIQTYTIDVNRAGALSNNAALSGLTISSGTLTPAFAATTLAYTDAVASGIASVTVTPTKADAGATITVNSLTVASGSPSGAIPLVTGANPITVVVTAADLTTTHTYTITVNRAGALSNNAALSGLAISSGTLTPAFATNTLNYADNVGNATSSITVTPTTASATATVKVNTVAVTSGSASGALALAVGPNPINVVVTAQDGTTTQAYLIVVTRAAAAVQTQVSGTSFTGTGTITATISGGGAGCGFGSYAFVGAPAAPPAGVGFPDGLFQFTATGCSGTVTVTATFPTAFQAGELYWKYGPTPGPVASHWYALGGGNNIVLAGKTATFTITDGALGDDDLAANGSITDAGGPGSGATVRGGGDSVTPAPALSTWGLLALIALLSLLAARETDRRAATQRARNGRVE